MKKILLALTIIASAFAVKAQTLDEIVDKHVAALGGKDNLAKVNSTVVSGDMTVQGAEVALTITTLQDKGSRSDISVMGTSNFIIYTATQGWRLMPIQQITSVEPMTESDVKSGVDNLETVSWLFNAKTKGSTLELLGKGDVDGTEAHKIKVTFKNGKQITCFVDAKTFFIIRVTSNETVNGSEQEITRNMGNYKAVNGVMYAHSMSFGPGELNVSKIEVNKAVDEKIFKPE